MVTVAMLAVLMEAAAFLREGEENDWTFRKSFSCWYPPLSWVAKAGLALFGFTYVLVTLGAHNPFWPVMTLFTDWPGCSSHALFGDSYRCFFF